VEAQKKIAEDAVSLDIDHEKFFFVMKPYVKGFEVDPLRLIKVYPVYIEK
jgi:ABC-type transport system substrate-binding protein